MNEFNEMIQVTKIDLRTEFGKQLLGELYITAVLNEEFDEEEDE